MKKLLILFILACRPCLAQWPDTPKPQPKTAPPIVRSNDFGKGFSFDNQTYALQGGGVAIIVGTLTYRPWLGLVAGVGSCAVYRAIHNPNGFFASNRMEFCAAGAAGSYVLMKLMHVHRPK